MPNTKRITFLLGRSRYDLKRIILYPAKIIEKRGWVSDAFNNRMQKNS